MSTYEVKPNSGSLFRNDDKQGDSHPDYKGQAEVNGVAMWMSAWLKTSKGGKKYMSLAFKPKVEAKVAPKPVVDEFDDIAF